jgi:hypothetical protein
MGKLLLIILLVYGTIMAENDSTHTQQPTSDTTITDSLEPAAPISFQVPTPGLDACPTCNPVSWESPEAALHFLVGRNYLLTSFSRLALVTGNLVYYQHQINSTLKLAVTTGSAVTSSSWSPSLSSFIYQVEDNLEDDLGIYNPYHYGGG